MESIITFLTEKTGIIAAVLVVIALIGGLQKIVLPMLKERKDKQAGKANLSLSNVKVEGPPPWSEAAKANFEIMNSQGGKAVMTGVTIPAQNTGRVSRIA